MTGRSLVVVAAFLLVGCAGAQTVVLPFEVTARREFPPDQRSKVWRRAVGAFDWTGRTAAVSDESGGLLVSVEQGSVIQCTEYRGRKGEPSLCRANESTRVTIGDDGVVSVRIGGKIRGAVPPGTIPVLPLTDLDRKQLQARADRWLDYVVGTNDYKPDPPNPPLGPAWMDL